MHAVTNQQFEELMSRYRVSFITWHKHITKFIKIDREAFLCDFQYVLFKSMSLFDVEKATASTERFERYFMSSLRKYVNSLLRKESSKRRRKEKKFVSFSIKKHDLEDKSNDLLEIEVNDIIRLCPRRYQGILRLRMDGNNIEEVCQKIHISPYQYATILNEIRSNKRFVKALSSG